MRVAYLTTSYPSVSHTFIRRELLEVERRLGDVHRFSVRRSPYRLVDEEDRRESERTFCLLAQPLSRWLRALVRRGLRRPRALLAGLRRAVQLGRRSERGLLRHLAYWLEALLLLDELDRRGVQHLHVHFGTNPAAVAAIARRMGGPPFSFTVHGPDEFDAPVGLALGEKIADAAFVVAISHFCAGQLRRWAAPEHWDRIRVVRCTVGEDFFCAARPVDPHARALVCVGRLAPQKGQLLLVEAFADAVAAGADAELVLAGDGELRARIEALVASRGIADRVRITGWIDGAAVREEILRARALVLPSFAEGLPMVIMEAFALGRPVLSTYVAGIPELVRDGESGWLVPSGSAELVREGILRVMKTDAARLSAMGEAGRAAVRAQHHTQVETGKLVRAFASAHGLPEEFA